MREGLRAHNAASAQLIPAGTPERSLHLHRHPLRVRSSNPGQAGARRRPRGRERSSLSREVKAAGRTAGSSPGGRGFVRGRGFLALRGSARPTAAAGVPGLTCAPPSSWDSPGGWWEGDRPALGQDAHCHSLISSFLTFTVTSVPGLRLGGRSPCPLERLGGRAIMRFSLGSFFFPCLLPQASPSPTPLQCPSPQHPFHWPHRLVPSRCAGSLASSPSRGSPTPQVLPVPTVTHDAVMSVSVLWENRWLPQIREIPGGLFTTGGRQKGGGETTERARDPGTSTGGGVSASKGWRKVGGEVTSEQSKESPGGDLTLRATTLSPVTQPVQGRPREMSQVGFPTSRQALLWAKALVRRARKPCVQFTEKGPRQGAEIQTQF